MPFLMQERLVTIDLDGTKFTYDFLPTSRIALPLPLDNKEVEDIRFVDTFKDPLQRAMENDAMYDEQDKELAESIEGLKAQDESLDEENYEHIGNLKQQEHEMPDIELNPLPKVLKYEFLGADKTYPVIVSDELSPKEMDKLLNLLRKHKKVIWYSITDLKGISPVFCTDRIALEEQCKPVVESQGRLSHAMREVVKNEVIKFLDAGIIYFVPHSEWESLVHCVPKKGGITVVKNEKDELIHNES
jgi:hypothetical protein